MKQKSIDVNVTLYKGNQRLTEAELDQLKSLTPQEKS